MRWENVGRFLRCLRFGLRKPRAFLGLVLTLEDELYGAQVKKHYGLGEGLPVADILDLFPAFSSHVSPYAYLDDSARVPDIALLRSFAKRLSPCTALEIGTWRGESIANLAAVAERCISLSLSDQELRDLGWSEDVIRVGRFFSRDLRNVVNLEHNSRTFDFSPYHGSVDLVFIDGDHSYEGVRSDTVNAFKLLKDRRSVIVWHDCCVSPEGRPAWPVVAGILDGSPPDKVRSIYRVSNTMCAVFTEDNLPTRKWAFPSVPNKVFTVDIASQALPDRHPGGAPAGE
jgi:hypothetical protein